MKRKWLSHGRFSKEFFLDHFSPSFLSQKWCEISIRIFCVLSGTGNLQFNIHTFSWVHKLFSQLFSLIFLSDALFCWNKCKGKLHPTHLMTLLCEWSEMTHIGSFAKIYLSYKLELHLTLENLVHSFQGRYPTLKFQECLSTLTLLNNMESRTDKQTWFGQVAKV